MSAPTMPLSWFAAHEARLAWRDWTMLMSGGRKRKDRAVAIGMGVFALGLHGVAYAVLAPHLTAGRGVDTALLGSLSISLILTFTMMVSQAMEQVTRAFYARDDLDLILSSPAPAEHLFAVRISAMALGTATMSGLVVAPFINVAAYLSGAHWLAAYVVIVAAAALAVGLAVLLTLTLFKRVGPRRTRLIAQITAAVIGASFLIGIQTVAILSYGTLNRFQILGSQDVLARLPALDSLAWLPARAVMGEPLAVVVCSFFALTLFAVIVRRGAREFQRHVLAAMSLSHERRHRVATRGQFRPMSARHALLMKEWTLLARDPWLISQTLMQLLYLIPPALLLYVNFGAKTNATAIIAPVLVMAAGQLAGALAWLAISGEDAPDLVATAPLTPAALTAAKVVSVLALIGAVMAPFVLVLMVNSRHGGVVTLGGILVAATCAILIQLWFRTQARRASFRRRQVASRTSTMLEALASILTAGTTAVAAAGSWVAVVPALLCALVMLVAFLIRPRDA